MERFLDLQTMIISLLDDLKTERSDFVTDKAYEDS